MMRLTRTLPARLHILAPPLTAMQSESITIQQRTHRSRP